MWKITKKAIIMAIAACCVILLCPVTLIHADEAKVVGLSETDPKEVYDGETFQVELRITGERETGIVQPCDIVLVLDCSGSMNLEDRFLNMQSAAKRFIDMIDFDTHRVGIVSYSSDTDSVAIMTDAEQLKEYIAEMPPTSGSTQTDEGIREAGRLLKKCRASATPTIILMTDGDANDYNAAADAAKEMRDNGITIFTVALLSSGTDPDTSRSNQELMSMATSAQTHHFVLGSQGLIPVYQKICSQMGEANPKNVIITQRISNKFELVPGSTDSNIPQPTLSGSTLVWKISEFRCDQTLCLTYQLKVKDGLPAGSYNYTSLGKISYNTYYGTYKEATIYSHTIKVKNRVPQISSISKNVFNAAGGEEIIISGENFTSNTIVKLDNTVITNFTQKDGTISFKMPAHSRGNALLSVENIDGEGDSAAVTFQINPVVTSVYPQTGAYDGGTSVKLKGRYFFETDTDGNRIAITFNGVEGTVTKVTSTYVYVLTPALNQSGTADIIVTNPDGTSVMIPDGYTYEEPVSLPAPFVDSVLKASAAELKIKGKHFRSGNGFQIKFNDVVIDDADITKVTGTYIYMKIPAALPAGIYDVTVINSDGTQGTKADAYEKEPEPTPPELFLNRLEAQSDTKFKIIGKSFRQGGSFSIRLGSIVINSADIEKVTGTYVYFNIPSPLPAGVYDLTVTNDDGSTKTLAGAYTKESDPPLPAPTIRQIVNTSGSTYKIYGTHFNSGGSFQVLVDNVSMTIDKVTGTYVYFTAASHLTAGQTYTVTVINSDGTKVEYTYIP